MAAVIAPLPSPDLAPRSSGHDRPHLRLLPGGGQTGSGRPAYWRRRLVAAVLVVLVLATAVVVARRVAELAGAPLQADPPASSATSAQPELGSTYVVQPGDTLWAIAERIRPDGDLRPVVDELAGQLGGAVLQPGQRLDLASLGR